MVSSIEMYMGYLLKADTALGRKFQDCEREGLLYYLLNAKICRTAMSSYIYTKLTPVFRKFSNSLFFGSSSVIIVEMSLSSQVL